MLLKKKPKPKNLLSISYSRKIPGKGPEHPKNGITSEETRKSRKDLCIFPFVREETGITNLGAVKKQMLLHLKVENHWQGLLMQPWLE